ncbi:MAG: hypothetical protein R2939_21425 [Kofleriaceae bacterium]
MRGGIWALALGAGLVAACASPELTTCDDGTVCGGDAVCLPAGGCADPRDVEACAGKGEGDACTGDFGEGLCVGEACRASRCGDGLLDPGGAEGCDEGAANADVPGASCRRNCQPARCGDGIVDDDEVCDDGNVRSGDGCAGDCRSDEVCGNGLEDSGEECDDGNDVAGDGCQPGCLEPRCGDGILDAFNGETCDDGAGNSAGPGAACRPNCQPGRCGDGIVDLDEACDDGNVQSADGCSGDCLSDETCGNGYVDFLAGETCDGDPLLARDGCTPLCRQEVPTWSSLAPTAGYDRILHAMAYDPIRDRVVVFGGQRNHVSTKLDTTLEWDGFGWHLRTDLAVAPAPRDGAAMAYDPAREVIVLHGGALGNGATPDETWEYDGVAWTQAVGTGPGGRHGATLTYDAGRRTLVLVGGIDRTGTIPTTTWERDANGVWSEAAVTGTPPARYEHAAAYDPAGSGRLVVFGGLDASDARRAETWALAGGAWSQLTVAGTPTARNRAAMAYDPTRNRVVLHGGFIGGSLASPVADTRELDGTSWSTAAGGATARGGHAMVWDGDRLVLFGGEKTTVVLPIPIDGGEAGETWQRVDATWTQITPGLMPPGLNRPAMVYDAARGQMMTFGGAIIGPIVIGVSPLRDETWVFAGPWWERRFQAVHPSARNAAGVAYDAARQRVVAPLAARATRRSATPGSTTAPAGSSARSRGRPRGEMPRWPTTRTASGSSCSEVPMTPRCSATPGPTTAPRGRSSLPRPRRRPGSCTRWCTIRGVVGWCFSAGRAGGSRCATPGPSPTAPGPRWCRRSSPQAAWATSPSTPPAAAWCGSPAARCGSCSTSGRRPPAPPPPVSARATASPTIRCAGTRCSSADRLQSGSTPPASRSPSPSSTTTSRSTPARTRPWTATTTVRSGAPTLTAGAPARRRARPRPPAIRRRRGAETTPATPSSRMRCYVPTIAPDLARGAGVVPRRLPGAAGDDLSRRRGVLRRAGLRAHRRLRRAARSHRMRRRRRRRAVRGQLRRRHLRRPGLPGQPLRRRLRRSRQRRGLRRRREQRRRPRGVSSELPAGPVRRRRARPGRGVRRP